MHTASTPHKQGPLSWSINLSQGSFNCDARMLKLLGLHAQPRSLNDILHVLDPQQQGLFKQALIDATHRKAPREFSAILLLEQRRHLVDVAIIPSTENSDWVDGTLKVREIFPSIEKERALLTSLFKRSNNGLLITDSRHRILMVNDEFCRATLYSEAQLLGKRAAILKSGHYNTRFYKKLWGYIDHHKMWEGELLCMDAKGDVFAQDTQIQRIDLRGEHFYISSTRKLDVSAELWKDDASLIRQSGMLRNKQQLLEAVEQQYQQLPAQKTMICAAFEVSVNRKTSHHALSWLVARQMAQLIHPHYVALLDNSVFAVCWEQEKNILAIDNQVRKLVDTLSRPGEDDKLQLKTLVTMGVSVLLVDARSPELMISHALQSLLTQSKQGLSSVHYFSAKLAKRFDHKRNLARLLETAIDSALIQVAYQPIYSLPDLKLAKLEALCRIKLDTRLPYTTQELINIAEEFDWVDRLDSLVTEKALRALPRIQQRMALPELQLTVNRSLSSDTLSKSCLEQTLTLFQQAKLSLDQVTLELTESSFFESTEHQQTWLNKMREAGAKIALDDFGTGFSSLSYLRELPIDMIKIDRSFVSNLSEQSMELEMIRMLCKLMKQLGGYVIAEGVETQQQLCLLQQAGVSMVQGYLFSKPLSEGDLYKQPVTEFPEIARQLPPPPGGLRARDIMSRDFPRLTADDSLASARPIFSGEGYSHIAVMEGANCLGVLYQSGYSQAVSPHIGTPAERSKDLATLQKRVHLAMDHQPQHIDIDCPIEDLVPLLIAAPEQVLVVDGHQGHCMGLIGFERIRSYLTLES